MYTNVFIELKLFYIARCFLRVFLSGAEEQEEARGGGGGKASERFGDVSFSNFHEILHLCLEIDFSIKASSADTFSSFEMEHTLSSFEMLLFSWLTLSLAYFFALNGCDSTFRRY